MRHAIGFAQTDEAGWVLVRREKFEAFRLWTAAQRQPLIEPDVVAIEPPPDVIAAIARGSHPVRAWREYRGLTQAQLAVAVGLNPLTIRYMERGFVPGRPDTKAKIADALGFDARSARCWRNF